MEGLLEKGKQGVRGLVQPFPTIQVRCAASPKPWDVDGVSPRVR